MKKVIKKVVAEPFDSFDEFDEEVIEEVVIEEDEPAPAPAEPAPVMVEPAAAPAEEKPATKKGGRKKKVEDE